MFKLEKAHEIEKKIRTKVILEFMRHAKRDKDDPNPDEEIRLNEEGRKMSKKKGEILSPQKNVSLAWGSQFKRAQETSLHAMLQEIGVDDSLEEMDAEISKHQKYGKKIIVDKRLGYDLSGSSGGESLKAFKEKRYIPYVIEKSDQLSIKAGDKISTTYTRHAGGLAEIIYRYSQVGNNFNCLVSEKKDKYERFGNQLERYLGTHSGIQEFFLAKVIEKNEGIEKRNNFIKLLGGGFKETEGMRVEIINDENEQEITIYYQLGGKNEKLVVEKKLLEEIIEERNAFEKKVNENISEAKDTDELERK